MICKNCNIEIQDNTRICPHCGASTDMCADGVPQHHSQHSKGKYTPKYAKHEKQNKKSGILIATVLGIVFVAVCWLLYPRQCNHEWIDATCTQAKTCVVCGASEGAILAHDWVDASCRFPKTCKTCKIAEGEPMGHIETGWKTVSTDVVRATVSSQKTCTVCKQETATQVVDMKSLNDTKKFLFTPVQFQKRLQMMLDDISGYSFSTQLGKIDGALAIGIFSDGNHIASLMLSDGDTSFLPSQKNDVGFNMIFGLVNKPDNSAPVTLALIRACDPSMDFYDAKSCGEELFDEENITKNGIKYAIQFGKSENSSAILACELCGTTADKKLPALVYDGSPADFSKSLYAILDKWNEDFGLTFKEIDGFFSSSILYSSKTHATFSFWNENGNMVAMSKRFDDSISRININFKTDSSYTKTFIIAAAIMQCCPNQSEKAATALALELPWSKTVVVDGIQFDLTENNLNICIEK